MVTMKKSLKDLNLLDRFLFAEAMEDPVIMTNMLEIILGEDIVLKYLPQSEREARKSPLIRFIKLDVWAVDVRDNIYDTEVQKENTNNLEKRSRLYQGIIDSKQLAPGEVDFNELKNVFIIIIMPFDLFGKGLYKYTFKMSCDEEPGLKLRDGATRIFLNTHGTNPDEVSEELVALLHYMEDSQGESAAGCKSEKLRDMQKRIEGIKSSEEIGVKYMQEWEEKIIEKRKARAEGLAEGHAEGLAKGLEQGLEQGLAKGHEEGIIQGEKKFLKELIQKKFKKGKDITAIAEELEESEEIIRQLME